MKVQSDVPKKVRRSFMRGLDQEDWVDANAGGGGPGNTLGDNSSKLGSDTVSMVWPTEGVSVVDGANFEA